MKNLTKTFLLLFVAVALTSCFFNGVKGNGNVTSETRKISDDFTRINAGNGLQVFLTNSADISLEVEADENLHELIETYVENGTLYIKTKKNIGYAKAKKVYVFVDKLNEIDIHSGGEIISDNTFKANNFKIGASSGGTINMRLSVQDLLCDTSSGASLNLKGTTKTIKVNSTSGSNLNAYDLEALSCDVDVSSGANVRLSVSETFNGNASSGGGIRYKGNPEVAKKSSSSGGSISNEKS
jgi:hypothetical protein